MDELIVQCHDFENAKDEIKNFSEQTTTDLDLKRVDDSKGVGEFFGDWFFGRGVGKDHLVKGEELNELTTQIQTHLHSINNTQIKLIKEFGQVYSALEALDKDYIRAILVSINATKETSEGIQRTQDQIKKIVENQRKTLEELKMFKQKLDGYAHLGDVDEMWESLAAVKEHSEQLTDMNEKNEAIVISVQESKEDVEAKIVEANNAISSLTQKIKYVYWIAGGAAGLAIIELILLMIKVI